LPEAETQKLINQYCTVAAELDLNEPAENEWSRPRRGEPVIAFALHTETRLHASLFFQELALSSRQSLLRCDRQCSQTAPDWKQSPYGKGTKTLVDVKVRNSREVDSPYSLELTKTTGEYEALVEQYHLDLKLLGQFK
jgi:hypothetical protein